MMQKYRISTNIGKDQIVKVDLKQNYDLLEILSLKFTQQDIYTSYCSDYGVVCGRISVNNGLGIPNARVSIFIPLATEDEEDPVVSKLYPYKDVGDRNESNYRYNLLPSRKQHGGHEPTGTFPDQSDILSREEVLEVYEKYYKYTVKTNNAGDFMIWGVPLGQQTLHVDVDLSDIGCFSLRPYDFIRQGIGVDAFKNTYSFKSSKDIDSLPQIVSFDKTIEVFPFWGNQELCEIGLSRADFDLSSKGVSIQPKAFLIGGIYTDNGKNSVNKNCDVRPKMGRKCDLVTKSGVIEAIRFTPAKDENNYPILEELTINEDIDDDGSFVLPLEMNMDYIFTNEFGENEITNDTNKGIPTSACYRFRFSMKDSGNERVRVNAHYLVPNIREYLDEIDESYAWSINLNDYPTNAIDLIINNVYGEFYPQDYFYRFTYNKVYTVSSFQGTHFVNTGGSVFKKDKFLGIKEAVPTEEEDCADKLTPPVNFGLKNYTFTLLIADFLLFLDYVIKFLFLQALNLLIKDILDPLGEGLIDFGLKSTGKIVREFTSKLQINNTAKLSLINYPECEECATDDLSINDSVDGPSSQNNYCKVATIQLDGDDSATYDRPIKIDLFTNTHPDTGDCAANATSLANLAALNTNQLNYYLEYDGNFIDLDPAGTGSLIYPLGGNYYLNDRANLFKIPGFTYTINVRDKNATIIATPAPTNQLEEGCYLYDTPYDESIATGYYVKSGTNRVYKGTLSPGDNVVSTLIAGYQSNVATEPPINSMMKPTRYCRDFGAEYRYLYTATPSYRSEFANGVFYVVPGQQSTDRLTKIINEYYKRKRVGKMFCGGVVNYSFIDNWLSGSLYFYLFKAKHVARKQENRIKYCRDIVRYVQGQDKFYYRSSSYDNTDERWGYPISSNNERYRLGHPTTIVDLGPRDEFIKEICVDEKLDPNCSVSRSIGPTTFKNFGELLGLAINYRMDVNNGNFKLNNFFDNAGFEGIGFTNVLDGDILQLMSINNEAGIEEFDLQSPKYAGYSFSVLDPEVYPQVFTGGTNAYGPLPVTFDFSDDGERIRSCLNEPTHTDYSGNTVQGRLTESSQNVPFFLWDKKGTGFGSYTPGLEDDQSWDYTANGVQVQPLQGMTYAYNLTGSPNDSSDKYLLLPMTYDFSGLTISGLNVIDNVEFDVVSLSDGHTSYDSEYPGFTYLYVTLGTLQSPIAGTLYVRYGTAGTWDTISWNNSIDFIIRKTQNYYTGNKQILSTPFMFYFGLNAGKTGLDKFINMFGPKGAFPSAE